MSAHVTEDPVSAKHAPATNPTYPEPTIVIFIRREGKRGEVRSVLDGRVVTRRVGRTRDDECRSTFNLDRESRITERLMGVGEMVRPDEDFHY